MMKVSANAAVSKATDGRFATLEAFTDALVAEQDQQRLDMLIGEAVALLHFLAGHPAKVQRLMLDLFPGEQLAGDAPRGLGKQMVGGGDKVKRRPLDYYPTPPEATRALIAAERPWLRRYRSIWEPCGRGGAIARELAAHQWSTQATDLVPDPTNDCAGADLFSIKSAPQPAVVTNFPFALARPMICHLWGVLGVE